MVKAMILARSHSQYDRYLKEHQLDRRSFPLIDRPEKYRGRETNTIVIALGVPPRISATELEMISQRFHVINRFPY